jgi:hypothetical protein
MAVSHDIYCDQNHASRQRCNQALARTPDALNALRPAPPAPEVDIPKPAERRDAGPEPLAPPPPSDAVRHAVIAGAMPSPSPYATRAWEDTARALDAGFSSSAHELPPPATREAAESRATMIAAAAGLVALVLVAMRFLLRRRGHGREQASDD